MSFYDVLTSHSLPGGLFPKGISNFSVDPSSGRFRVYMASAYPCDAKFETRMRYECEITANLSYGKIANLSGVAAQELFLWLPVKGIQTPKNCDASADGGEVVLLKAVENASGRTIE